MSAVWIGMSIVISFAAMLGGLLAARIARATPPPKVLAGLVLGVAMALIIPPPEAPAPHTIAPTVWEAAGNSRQPRWLLYLNTILGLLGGSLVPPWSGRLPVHPNRNSLRQHTIGGIR